MKIVNVILVGFLVILFTFGCTSIYPNTGCDGRTEPTFDYLCNTLDSNALYCGCYFCKTTYEENGVFSGKTTCDALAAKDECGTWIKWTGRCN